MPMRYSPAFRALMIQKMADPDGPRHFSTIQGSREFPACSPQNVSWLIKTIISLKCAVHCVQKGRRSFSVDSA